jgi:hypothetical protein
LSEQLHQLYDLLNKRFGKYRGIVKSNHDDENPGCLQVEVQDISGNQQITARPATPPGSFFLPEVETYVWIEFEGGDPGMPIWTDMWHVPGTWPDEAKDDPTQKRVIKTTSGHTLVFDDRSDSASIQIKDGVNGHVITLNNNGVTISAQSGENIVLNKQGINIDSGAGEKIQITPKTIQIDPGPGGTILLGSSASLPVIRLTDQGIGNLGAPVAMAVTTNTQVLA